MKAEKPTASLPPSDLGNHQREDASLDQEIRQTVDALLIQALALPEERAQRLLDTLHNARQIRQDYQAQRNNIEYQLEALLQVIPPDQTRIQQILQELEAAKTHYYHQVLQTDQALWAQLTAEEQAKYILFQRHFMQQLQDIIAQIRQERVSLSTRPPTDFLLRRQNEESVIRQPRNLDN